MAIELLLKSAKLLVPKVDGIQLPEEDIEVHHARLLERLELFNFEENEVAGDGNCQFRALSFHLHHTDTMYDVVRKNVVEQLTNNREFYRGAILKDYDECLKEMNRLRCLKNKTMRYQNRMRMKRNQLSLMQITGSQHCKLVAWENLTSMMCRRKKTRNCGFYLLKEKIQLYHEEGQHLAKEWIDHKLKRVAPAYCLKKKREAEWTFMHKKIDDSAKLHVKQKSEAELALLRKTNEDLELDKDKDGGSGKSVNGRNRSMKAMGVEDYIKEIAAANVLARTIFGDAELLPEWKDVLRPAKRGRE